MWTLHQTTPFRGTSRLLKAALFATAAAIAVAPDPHAAAAAASPIVDAPAGCACVAATGMASRSEGSGCGWFQDEEDEGDVASLLQAFLSKVEGRTLETQERGQLPEPPPEVSGTRTTNPEVAVAVSAMLFGTVTFAMLLVYTMSSPDEDIRYYCCKIIGDAISIFVAVLVYEAGHSFFHFGSAEGGTAGFVLDVGQLILWYMFVQVLTKVLAGAGEPAPLSSKSIPRDQQQHWRTREMQLRSLSGILTHVTGFAAISVWAGLQRQFCTKSSSPWEALLPIPIACASLALMFVVGAVVRHLIIHLDKVKDVSEALWNDCAGECVDEAFGMSISWLCMNTLQYFVVDALSDREFVLRGAELGPEQACQLCLAMLAAACCSGLAMLTMTSVAQRGDYSKELAKRAFNITSTTTSMSFAWSVLFCARAAMRWLHPDFDNDAVVGRICVALGVSLFAFVWVFLLDKCADSLVGLEHHVDTHKALVKLIMSVGLLVGFAWELAFSSAAGTLDEAVEGPASGALKIGLSLGLCTLVTPAYMLYITPVIDHSRRMVHKSSGLQPTFMSMFSVSCENLELAQDLGLERQCFGGRRRPPGGEAGGLLPSVTEGAADGSGSDSDGANASDAEVEQDKEAVAAPEAGASRRPTHKMRTRSGQIDGTPGVPK